MKGGVGTYTISVRYLESQQRMVGEGSGKGKGWSRPAALEVPVEEGGIRRSPLLFVVGREKRELFGGLTAKSPFLSDLRREGNG